MSKIKITQVKSGIDRMARQKRTLKALGLRNVHYSVEVEATPQILGMVKAVHHLVKVEDAHEGETIKKEVKKGYTITSQSAQIEHIIEAVLDNNETVVEDNPAE